MLFLLFKVWRFVGRKVRQSRSCLVPRSRTGGDKHCIIWKCVSTPRAINKIGQIYQDLAEIRTDRRLRTPHAPLRTAGVLTTSHLGIQSILLAGTERSNTFFLRSSVKKHFENISHSFVDELSIKYCLKSPENFVNVVWNPKTVSVSSPSDSRFAWIPLCADTHCNAVRIALQTLERGCSVLQSPRTRPEAGSSAWQVWVLSFAFLLQY